MFRRLARQPSEIRRETPPALDAVVSKCLALDPDDRYQNAGELRTELQRLLDSVERNSGIEIPEFEVPVVPAARGASILRRIGGGVLAALLLASAAIGVWQLERSESGKAAGAAEEAASAAVPREDPFALAFADLTARVNRAREMAAGAEGPAAFAAEGSAFWEQAQGLAARREADAFRAGWFALECYLGPVICPNGMVFVPPGETVVERGADPVFVDGFFIDEHEVNNGRFRAFALDGAHPWPMPDYLGGARLTEELLLSPVVGSRSTMRLRMRPAPSPRPGHVLAADRSAMPARPAASRDPAALSLGAEWSPGAASAAGEADSYPGAAPVGIFELDTSPFGCRDVAGNVMEWTRSVFVSPYDPAVAEKGLEDIWFGSALAVRGGCYTDERSAVTERRSAWFDEASPLIGFRCVLPFPADSETIDELLR